ncbi:MAG: hypothetical protein IKI69_01545 [Oscillospiraceae bacterium]|nr:hypothetical protein [Oscillospiraceae bacterium]
MTAELDGISALLCLIGMPFIDGEVTGSNRTIGEALFAIEQQIDRVSKDFDAIEQKQWELEKQVEDFQAKYKQPDNTQDI